MYNFQLEYYKAYEDLKQEGKGLTKNHEAINTASKIKNNY